MKEVVPPSVIVVTRAILGIFVSKVWKHRHGISKIIRNVARIHKPQ